MGGRGAPCPRGLAQWGPPPLWPRRAGPHRRRPPSAQDKCPQRCTTRTRPSARLTARGSSLSTHSCPGERGALGMHSAQGRGTSPLRDRVVVGGVSRGGSCTCVRITAGSHGRRARAEQSKHSESRRISQQQCMCGRAWRTQLHQGWSGPARGARKGSLEGAVGVAY